MPELYFREDLETHLALFPDLKAHTTQRLRHLAWCHADDGTFPTLRNTGPDTAILTLWCVTCGALEACIAVTTTGGGRCPPCPHAGRCPWDVWYAEGVVNIGCHRCENLLGYLAVATRNAAHDDSEQVLTDLKTFIRDQESDNDPD